MASMWEIAAIVEVLERRGLCTKQDLYDIIIELRRKEPTARVPKTQPFPEPYLLTEVENKLIDQILALLNENGLPSHQERLLLKRLGSLIEVGERVPRKTTHFERPVVASKRRRSRHLCERALTKGKN